MAEWTIAAVLKAAIPPGIVGSNPTPSASGMAEKGAGLTNPAPTFLPARAESIQPPTVMVKPARIRFTAPLISAASRSSNRSRVSILSMRCPISSMRRPISSMR